MFHSDSPLGSIRISGILCKSKGSADDPCEGYIFLAAFRILPFFALFDQDEVQEELYHAVFSHSFFSTGKPPSRNKQGYSDFLLLSGIPLHGFFGIENIQDERP